MILRAKLSQNPPDRFHQIFTVW